VASRKDQKVFTISIEGIDLPDDVVVRMNETLRRAALTEIAKVDLRGNDLTFRPIMAQMLADGNGGGGTGGGGAHLVIAERR